MKPGTPWFEDETLWEATYPFMFAEERFAAAEAEVTELPKLTGSPFHRVLDLCCGPGRHSIPLARQGTHVTAVEKRPDGSILVQTREITDDWYRIQSHWLLIRDHQVTEIRFDNALYSGWELADLLKKTGFERVKLFGSLQGIPYDVNAKRLVAVAMKPA
jgi:hypothetical protein